MPSALATVPSGGNFWWVRLESGRVQAPVGQFPPQGLPGSLMKLVAAAVLGEEGGLSTEEILECRGKMTIQQKTYTCPVPHGKVSLVQALGCSCNVYFSQAAAHINPRLFLDYAHQFGLDQEVSGHPSGLFPKTVGVTAQPYVLGLSHDLQPNLLQILRMTSLIASRGQGKALYLPGEWALSGRQLHLSHGTWSLLEQGMQLAARHGTARHLDPENRLHLAVKTGTVPHGARFQSWITGYFPYESPKYAFCLRSPFGTSQDQAVPLAKAHLFGRQWQ